MNAPPGRHTARIHSPFGDDTHTTVLSNRVDATLTLEDGRQVTLGILADGTVTLRAFAGEPYATNNADVCSVSFRLPTLEDMVLDKAEVTGVHLRTMPLTPRSLASEDADGTWHIASPAIHDRVTALRTLLSLRDTPEDPS